VLVEEGKLALDEPVERLLPELANRRVLKRPEGPLDETVPARRSIIVRDLLAFTMGFGILPGPSMDAHPIQKAANERKLGAFGPPMPQDPPAPEEWMRCFAELPLMCQPGERWLYNTGAEVLSVLIARAAGKPLEDALHERVLGPLGMKDTAFAVPAEKIARLGTSYMPNAKTGALEVYDEAAGGQWSRPPAFPSASAGLVSTIDDCFAFSQMMLNGGTMAGKRTRVLTKASVDAMTTDQLTAPQKAASPFFTPDWWDGRGWGLGICLANKGAPRGFGWDGGLGTSWWSDPASEITGILLTQRAGFPQMSRPWVDFWSSVYDAIEHAQPRAPSRRRL